MSWPSRGSRRRRERGFGIGSVLGSIFKAQVETKNGAIRTCPNGYILSDKGWTNAGGVFLAPRTTADGRMASLRGGLRSAGAFVLNRGGKQHALSAHRLAYFLGHGADPMELQVCHACDFRRCCNPAHLFLGTCAENLRDCVEKGRMHPGSKNAAAKLTEAQVAEMRALLDSGEKQAAVARRFGVSTTAVWKIANGLKWKHVGQVFHPGEERVA